MPLVIDAVILKKDIGFVQEAQKSIIKIEAFPLTCYGTIDGTVLRISTDRRRYAERPEFVGSGRDGQSLGCRGEFRAAGARISGYLLPRRSIQVDEPEGKFSPSMAVKVE
jgi:hemolysin D